MIDTSIISLYKRSFGFVGLRWPQKIEVNTKVVIDASGQQIAVNDPKQFMEAVNGSMYFMPCKLDDLWLPNEPLISISGGKRIVKSYMTGLKGSVKEEISQDDYSIQIMGIAINETDENYPYQTITSIKQLCEKQGSVKVVNKLLAIFDIHELVIESWNFQGEEGAQSYQPYTLNCVSDRPVELMLKEGF